MMGTGSTSWGRSKSSIMPFGGRRLNSSESTMSNQISIFFSSFGITGSSGNRKGKCEVVVTHGSQSGLGGKSLATKPLEETYT